MNRRPAVAADFDTILALNAESVQFLSPLNAARLQDLHSQAALHEVIVVGEQVVAFLLAFREHARYDSVNFQWFAQRYERFLYVDRVVVSKAHQRAGLGRALYAFVFAHAAATGAPLITCEYDLLPPNPVSQAFHARFGFQEVGRQTVANGTKWVSLQAAKTPAQ